MRTSNLDDREWTDGRARGTLVISIRGWNPKDDDKDDDFNAEDTRWVVIKDMNTLSVELLARDLPTPEQAIVIASHEANKLRGNENDGRNDKISIDIQPDHVLSAAWFDKLISTPPEREFTMTVQLTLTFSGDIEVMARDQNEAREKLGAMHDNEEIRQLLAEGSFCYAECEDYEIQNIEAEELPTEAQVNEALA